MQVRSPVPLRISLPLVRFVRVLTVWREGLMFARMERNRHIAPGRTLGLDLALLRGALLCA